MEFDWTTFALEVLNFLVLVWLLKRFFYQPVMGVIEARRVAMAKTLDDAEMLRRDAEALKSEYQAHLAHADMEREAARAQLDRDIAAERARRLAALEAEIAEERGRRHARNETAHKEQALALERNALRIAARFASRFLERLASPELEARLADLSLSELVVEGTQKLDTLRSALREPGASIKVFSAYPLDAERRSAFTKVFSQLADRPLVPVFTEDAVLKAGVCIMAGSWVLMANLRDELGFFAESFGHGG